MSNLVGGRTLRTVGGSALPYDIPSTAGRSPGDTYQVYAGSLELSAGLGNYGFRDSTRYTSAGGFSSYNLNGDDGYATQSGTTLTLKVGEDISHRHRDPRRGLASCHARRG